MFPFSNGVAAITNTYATPVVLEVPGADYTEATRPEWTVGNAVSKASTNAAVVVYTWTSARTITGMAVVSSNVKNDTVAAGAVMLSSEDFATLKVLDASSVLQVTYTLSLAGS